VPEIHKLRNLSNPETIRALGKSGGLRMVRGRFGPWMGDGSIPLMVTAKRPVTTLSGRRKYGDCTASLPPTGIPISLKARNLG